MREGWGVRRQDTGREGKASRTPGVGEGEGRGRVRAGGGKGE